ncbi:MAG: LamG-like jellyroll fold domain-containing protein, partial [Pseudomonadota bacterium]
MVRRAIEWMHRLRAAGRRVADRDSKSQPLVRDKRLETLEPRLLMAADLAAGLDVAAAVAVDVEAVSTDAEPADLMPVAMAPVELPLVASSAADVRPGEPGANDPASRRELVVIDASLPDLDTLRHEILSHQSSRRHIDLVVIAPHENGLAAIGQILESQPKLNAIHVISHGESGTLQLGASRVDSTNLGEHGSTFVEWGESLTSDGDLLFYACDLGSGDRGMQFLRDLAALTDADVAASNDLTGGSERGGDWELEVITGDVDTRLVVGAQFEYAATLDITSNLIAHYQFDEGSGTTATDAAGGDNNGTLVGIPSPPAHTTGVLNGALDFTGNDEYVQVSHSANLDLGANDFTVSFWINTSQNPIGSARILGKLDATAGFVMYMDGAGQINALLDDGTNFQTGTGAAINDGAWHHVALVRDGASAALYYDGALEQSFSLGVVGDIGNTDDLLIGVSTGVTSEFDGVLDDVRLYDRALTASDIAEFIPTLTVDTASDYSNIDPNYGDTSSVGSLLANKGADGLISLREALAASNNTAGTQTVEFNISGAGPHTIPLVGILPSINDTIVLDGWSEPDYANDGTPVIFLDGTATITADGLDLLSGSGGSTVRGFGIMNFGDTGIEITSNNNWVYGNWIGLDTDGLSVAGINDNGIEIFNSATGNRIGPNADGSNDTEERNVIGGADYGIYIRGALTSNNVVAGNYIGVASDGVTSAANSLDGVRIDNGANNNTVGGSTVASRNIIGWNGEDGVHIEFSDQNTIENNYIGVGADGLTATQNDHNGVHVSTVSGSNQIVDNFIGQNGLSGVAIDSVSSANVVQGNAIGTNPAGTLALGHQNNGIFVENGAFDNLIGGTNAGDGNVIANSGGGGVFTDGILIDSTAGAGNSLLGNILFDNAGLGIDHAGGTENGFGVTSNSNIDGIDNFPVITTALISGSNIAVSGSLDSSASAQYRIEFFQNPLGIEDGSGHGEGRILLGADTVTTDGLGNATINAVLSGVTVSVGDRISATATRISAPAQVGLDDLLAYGASSEFSLNVIAASAAVAPVLAVPSSTLTFNEGDAAILVASTGTVSDSDSPNFNGGALSISYTAGGTANDQLAVRNEGSGVGQVGVLGSTVSYGGTTVGTLSGGSSGTGMTVTFNSNATAAVVQAVLRNVTYQNTAVDPDTNARTLQFDLTDDTLLAAIPDTAPIDVEGDSTLVVTTTAETEDGDTSSVDALLADRGADGFISLVEAIKATNATTGANTIEFDIPLADAGHVYYQDDATANSLSNVVATTLDDGSIGDFDADYVGTAFSWFRIQPTAALPTITDELTIDGYSQSGAQANTLAAPLTSNAIHKIEIDGQNAGGGVSGLFVTAADVEIRGLVINQFSSHAVNLFSGNGATVTGNYLGTDVTGTVDLGNGNDGVSIGSSLNTVGGITAADRNLISGNDGQGVLIYGGSNNSVIGNFIGIDVRGTSALGNTFDGVRVNSLGNTNTIGGTSTTERNLIAGNNANGVRLDGAGVHSNAVIGNYIGVDVTGTSDLGNANDGVIVLNGSNNNDIGDTVAGSRNVISGNDRYGIYLTGGGVTGNEVEGNYIGTNATGTGAIANGTGIQIRAGAQSNTVGGTTAAARNIISGNANDGIYIGDATTTGNVVAGNYIGLDFSGGNDLGNLDRGVQIEGSANNNTVGGSLAARNVISGNDADGVIMSTGASNNFVQSNIIGLNVTGTAAVANGSFGVRIANTGANNTIGGNGAALRNIISGNTLDGVRIESSAGTANAVQGNYIGTDITGLSALGNASDGIQVSADGQIIGGTGADEGNLITGNDGNGILASGVDGLTIQGNIVGLNAAQTAAIGTGNGANGVVLSSSTNVVVGGSVSGAANVISGNTDAGSFADGIYLTASDGNTIQGNYIGTNSSETLAFGNRNAGIALQNSDNNLIGGFGGGEGNVIAHNLSLGISVASNSEGNSFLGNRIYSNVDLGIDLVDGSDPASGVTPNDVGDSDSGANNLLNTPVLTSVVTDGAGSVEITGTLNAEAGTNYRIEFFASATADGSGHGEAERYLWFVNTLTDGSGDATFAASFGSTTVAAGEFVTAVATAIVGGDSSEFAMNVVATGLGVTAPTSVSTDEDVAYVFSGANVVSVDDGSAGDGELRVSLSVTEGTLSLATLAGISFVAGANNASSMVIEGLESAINSALDGLQYAPLGNYHGADALSIEVESAGLTGYYSFDGDVTDQSAGPSADGSLEADALFTLDGTRGQVLSLDGTGDHVAIPSTFNQPSSVTIGGWVNFTANPSRSEFISIDDRVHIALDEAGNGVKGSIQVGASSWIDLNSGVFLGGTGWHHVMYTFDDALDTHALYIDGSAVASAIAASSIYWTGAATTYVGQHPASGWNLNGLVDDVRIYSRALAAGEVSAIANDSVEVTGSVAVTVDAVNDGPTFDVGDGVALVSPTMNGFGDSVVQPDGKIVVVGRESSDFSIRRYHVDGTLDSSFGTAGVITFDVQGSDLPATIALQPDGKILVGGYSATDMGLARLTSDGALDPTFGTGGTLVISANDAYDLNDIHVLPDGKLLLAGSSGPSLDTDVTLIRLDSNGGVDSTFGTSGYVTIDTNPAAADWATYIDVLSDGSFLVQTQGSSANPQILKFDSNGTLDAAFATSGVLTTGFSSDISLVVNADDSFVVAGLLGGGDFVVTKYDASGSVDASFGTAGTTTVDVGGSDRAFEIETQSDGKYLVGGVSGLSLSVIRLDTNGVLDGSFGTGGIVVSAEQLIVGGDNATLNVNADDSFQVSAATQSLDVRVIAFEADGNVNTRFDDSPVTSLDGSPGFNEDGAAVVLDADVEVFDEELTTSDNFAGATLTLNRNGGADGDDVFSATGALSALTEGGNLNVGATTIGVVTTNSAGTLVLTFNGNATNALVNAAMQLIAYENTSDTPPANVQIDWTFDDENVIAQGSGGAMQAAGSTIVTITAMNDDPIARNDPGDAGTEIASYSPIGYWRLGESSGVSAGDVGSGGNNGTYNNVTLGHPSPFGDTAVHLNGTTSYIEVPHDPSYLVDSGTVQFWFNADSFSVQQGLVSKDANGFGTGGHLDIDVNTSGQISARLQTPSSSFVVNSSANAMVGTWHHVAFVFGPSGMELFLDGQSVGSNAYAGGLGTSSGGSGNTEPWVFGASTQGSGIGVVTPLTNYFAGAMDEVAFFGSELSGEQIRSLYVAGAQDYTINEGETLSVTAATGVLSNDEDPEGDPLNATLLSGPSNAQSFSLNADGSFTYTPNANFSGTDSFVYQVDDGNSGTATATATITVLGINDAPVVAAPGGPLGAVEQANLSLHGVGFAVSDVDEAWGGATATLNVGEGAITVLEGDSGVTITGGNGTGNVTLNGTITQLNNLLTGAGTGTITYVNGSDTPSASTAFTVTVNDQGNTGADPGISGTATTEEGSNNVTINITAMNDAPVVTAPGAALGATEQIGLTVHGTGFSVSDVDEAGGGASATLNVGEGIITVVTGTSGVTVTGGTNGTGNVTLSGTIAQVNNLLTGAGTGTITYLNDLDAPSAATTLTVTVNDLGNTGDDPGAGGTGTATTEEGSNSVTINVTGTNDAPIATADAYSTTEDSIVNGNAITDDTGSGADSDPDGDPFTVTQVNGAAYTPGSPIALGSGAQVTFQPTGFFTYNPNGAFDGLAPGGSAMDAFTYQIGDGNGGFDTETVTITINGANDPPVISLTNGGQTFIEGGTPVLFDLAAVVTDNDSSDFDGGNLTASVVGNATSDDRVGIRNQGTNAGEIGVSGANVTYGGVQIGTFTGGTDGSTPLVVTLNASATVTAVQALASNITFSNVSEAPSTLDRIVRITVNDGDGGTSNNGQNVVFVTAINDAPVVSAPGAALGATEQTNLSLHGVGFSVSDADEAGGGANATLNVGEGAITVVTGTSGVTVTGGTNGTGNVTLSGTIAQLNNLLTGAGTGTITYLNGSDTPSASTTFTVTVNDQGNTGDDPGSSGTATTEEGTNNVTINITAMNDAPVVTAPGAALGATEQTNLSL